jgi:hypothetical protein
MAAGFVVKRIVIKLLGITNSFQVNLPNNAQCAAFDLIGNICLNKWSANFSCACRDKKKNINPSFSFSCNKVDGSFECEPREPTAN